MTGNYEHHSVRSERSSSNSHSRNQDGRDDFYQNRHSHKDFDRRYDNYYNNYYYGSRNPSPEDSWSSPSDRYTPSIIDETESMDKNKSANGKVDAKEQKSPTKTTDGKKSNTEHLGSSQQSATVLTQTLEDDVLKIFGERLLPERVLAPEVNPHLAKIWEDIIKGGLPTEERKKLLTNFPPPKNCILMDPPKLNLEVKTALDNTIQKRDQRIVEKQEKITASLAGTIKAIEIILKSNSPEKTQLLESLNSVMRLLTDLQHDETEIRRNLILKNIKASMKDTLKDSKSDQWLFGNELSEKLKTAKTLQKSTNDLKPVKKPSSDNNSKNYYAPSHHNRSRGGGQKQFHHRNYRSTPQNKNQPPKYSQSGGKKKK